MVVVGDGATTPHTTMAMDMAMEDVVLPEAMLAATLAPHPLLNRKGPPVLPWMRSPAEIGLLQPLPLGQVPLLDPRYAKLVLLYYFFNILLPFTSTRV